MCSSDLTYRPLPDTDKAVLRAFKKWMKKQRPLRLVCAKVYEYGKKGLGGTLSCHSAGDLVQVVVGSWCTVEMGSTVTSPWDIVFIRSRCSPPRWAGIHVPVGSKRDRET